MFPRTCFCHLEILFSMTSAVNLFFLHTSPKDQYPGDQYIELSWYNSFASKGVSVELNCQMESLLQGW